jgi:hypothetical protein
MALAKHFVGVASLALLAGGCVAPSAPGMVLVQYSGTSSGPGSMLVAFPITACTATASAVFLDEKGGFVGAVAPGTATYLAFPEEATHLFVVSSQDVTAEKGTWAFRRHRVARPPERVEVGLLVEVPRVDAKNCYRNAAPAPTVVTYEVATRATKDLKWLDVRQEEGTRWLEEHRARVTELLGRMPGPAPEAPPSTVSPTTRAP